MKKHTVIITGAAGALGSELAMAMAGQGWSTVMVDRNRRGLEEVYDRIEVLHPGQGVLYPMDLAGITPDEVDEFIARVCKATGGIDAIVHCAAHFESLTPLEHFDPADWLVHMQVNLNAAWLLSARALTALRISGQGRLVFMLEDLDKLEGPFWGAYGVSKHALKALVNQFSEECKSTSVDVRGVNPGPMRSDLRSRAYHSENPQDQGDPRVVADEITAYLCSETEWGNVFMELPTTRAD